MMNLEFKVIEQANGIADGDYLLTIHDGEIKKVAKADAKVGGDGGRVLIPYYKFIQENVYENGSSSSTTSILYNIGYINGTNYIIVKDSEWRKIKEGSPVYVKYIDTPSSDFYGLATNIGISPNMFNSMGSAIDYDGKSTSVATMLFSSGGCIVTDTNGSNMSVLLYTNMYVISATTFRNYLNYEGGKPPYNTYEGGAEKALEVLEELGYFDVD